MSEGSCCWHTYHVKTSNPPIVVQRCCWCRAERDVMAGDLVDDEHGPYA